MAKDAQTEKAPVVAKEADTKTETKADAKPAEAEKKNDPKETAITDVVGPNDHKLQTPWTLYFDKKLAKHTDYAHFEANLHSIGSFNTVEGFWRHYAYLRDPDTIPRDHNLYLFRHSYIPAWETFPNGGCWIIKVRKRNGVIHRLWEELCFACIGELFEEPDIAGIVLSTRGRDDLLSVWNADNTNPEVRFKIGERMKEILNMDESTQVEYKYFSTSMRDGSTFRNAKAYVYAAQAYVGN